jgi:hypothetical protein
VRVEVIRVELKEPLVKFVYVWLVDCPILMVVDCKERAFAVMVLPVRVLTVKEGEV